MVLAVAMPTRRPVNEPGPVPTATVDTCSMATDFDTVLEVFSGSCANLIWVDCNDDACGLQSAVSFPVTSGAHYLIRAGGYRGAQGEGLFEIQCLADEEPQPAIIAIHDEPGDELRIRFVELGAAASAYELERSGLVTTGFARDATAVITPGAGYYEAVTALGGASRQFFRIKAIP